MILALSACGNTNNEPLESQELDETVSEESLTDEEVSEPSEPASDIQSEAEAENSNILIAYFSRAGENNSVGYIEQGNTAIVAEMIAEQTDGALFEIRTVTPYPEEYRATTDIAQQEKMKTPDLNLWGDMPMAVYTFLESYDFSGKTIVPFCTHEGSGLSGTVQSISDTCFGAEVLSGLAIRGQTAQESRDEAREAVTNWLRENAFAE